MTNLLEEDNMAFGESLHKFLPSPTTVNPMGLSKLSVRSHDLDEILRAASNEETDEQKLSAMI